MKVKIIEYNWHGLEEWGFCDNYEVGKKGVVRIDVHPAQGEGDKWYWTVVFEDGQEVMIFNPCKVTLIPE